jgi:hypothetical protein
LYCLFLWPRVLNVLLGRESLGSLWATAQTERLFPHHVDIIVPPGGLGTRLDAMYEFHAQHGIKPQRGHGKHSAAQLFAGVLPMRF